MRIAKFVQFVFDSENVIKVYPNPASDVIKIEGLPERVKAAVWVMQKGTLVITGDSQKYSCRNIVQV